MRYQKTKIRMVRTNKGEWGLDKNQFFALSESKKTLVLLEKDYSKVIKSFFVYTVWACYNDKGDSFEGVREAVQPDWI